MSNNNRPSRPANQPAAQSAPAAAQPTPAEQEFRRETEAAMAGDLMSVSALAPDAVAAALPAPTPDKAPEKAPAIAEEIAGKSAAKAPVQTSARPEGHLHILEMLAAGKLTPKEAERLIAATPAKPEPMPYLGDANAPATREELKAVVQEVLAPKLPANTEKAEMLELVNAMVEKFVKGMREPSEEDKAILERKKTTRAQLIREQFEMIAQQKRIQDFCPHERATIDGKSHGTVTALHNYPDGMVRGICNMCQKIIEPGDDCYRMVTISHYLAMSAAQ